MKNWFWALLFAWALSTSSYAQGVPDLTNISPRNGIQGATVAVTLTGSNFVSGSTSLVITGRGIQTASLRVDSGTSAVATIVLAGPPSKYQFRVATSSGSGLSSQTFTVTSSSLATASDFDVGSYVGGEGGAGYVDGVGDDARFASPNGIWAGATSLYVADMGNAIIRKVDPQTGRTSTIAGVAGQLGTADGPGLTATFVTPVGIWGDGSYLYITDTLALTIRKLELLTGNVTTVAGSSSANPALVDGTGTAARFVGPTGIWGDATNLYVADSFSTTSRSIRKVVIATGEVSTVADLGNIAKLPLPGTIIPVGLWGDATNLWIADSGRNLIRRMPFSSNQITTFAGAENLSGSIDAAIGTSASFVSPSGLWGNGTDLYVAETSSQTIRRISMTTSQVTTLAGKTNALDAVDGPSGSVRFTFPAGITGDSSIGVLYVTELGNHDIRKVVLPSGTTSTIAGKASPPGAADGIGTDAQFSFPWGIWGDQSGIYVSDTLNSAIRRIEPTNQAVSTFAGRARFPSFTTGFGLPTGIWSDGLNLYVTDSYYDTIRQVNLSTKAISTIAGNATLDSGYVDGVGGVALFHTPIAIWGDGQSLYIIDTNNFLVRQMVLSTRVVSTLAGSPGSSGVVDAGKNARFYSPISLWGSGQILYVLDGNGIRTVNVTTGQVSTFAGSITDAGRSDGPLLQARFNQPAGIWGDGTSLYVADTGNNTIRRIDLQFGRVTTVAGSTQGGDNADQGTQIQVRVPARHAHARSGRFGQLFGSRRGA